MKLLFNDKRPTDFKFPIFGDNHLTGAVHIYPDLKELGDNMRADSIVSYVAPMTKDTNLKCHLQISISKQFYLESKNWIQDLLPV